MVRIIRTNIHPFDRVGQAGVSLVMPRVQTSISQDIPRQSSNQQVYIVKMDTNTGDEGISIPRAGVYDIDVYLDLDVPNPGANYYQLIIRRLEYGFGPLPRGTDLIGTNAVSQGSLSINITATLNDGDAIVLIVNRSFGLAPIYYTITDGNIRMIRR